jgi:hypothetical protein
MNKSRMAVLGAVAAFALLLVGGAGPAAAQTASAKPLSQVMKITGTAKNGKTFKGTYTIQRFKSSGGKVYAVGTVKGRLKGRTVTRRNVKVPATVAQKAQTSQAVPPITPTPNACRILSLHLGAIDLNLLGLRVRTNPIDALIEAVPGAGNLLGNLLCTITGLLDPNTLTTGQIAALLNAILGILGGL